MEFITGGGEAAGGMEIVAKTLDEEEQEINTTNLAIEGATKQLQFNILALKDYAADNNVILSIIEQAEQDTVQLQGLHNQQLAIALSTVEKAKKTENTLLLIESKCDLSNANAEQVSVLSGQKQLLENQLSATQLLLQNEKTAKSQIDKQLSTVITELNETIDIVGKATSADEQVKLLAQVVKTKETEKERLNEKTQQLQIQLQDVANKLSITENGYSNQLEELRQAALLKEKERLKREDEFSQFQKQTDQQLQLVLQEKQTLEDQVTNNVFVLTNVNQEIAQVKEQYEQMIGEKQLQITNITGQYNAKLDEVNDNFALVQNNNQYLAGETERLTKLVTELENNNQSLVAGSDNILALQLAESSKELEELGKEITQLRTNNLALTTNATRLQQEVANNQTNVIQTNQQVSSLTTEKETLRKTNAELTSQVNLLKQETQQLTNSKEELVKIGQKLTDANSKATALQLEKATLTSDNTKLRNDVRECQQRLNEANGRLTILDKENTQLAIIDPNAAVTTQTLMVTQQQLQMSQNKEKILQLERDNAVKQSQTLKKEVADLRKSVSDKNNQVEECKLLSQKEQKIVDAMKRVRLFRLDLTTGKVNEEKAESFNPQTNILHQSVLVFGPTEKRLIEASVPYEAKLRKMTLVEGTQFFTLLQKDPAWQGDYVVLKKSEWSELRKNYNRPCVSTISGGGPLIINTTDTTTTTTTTQTLLGLGSSVLVLNHIDALNQLSWQENARHLRELPGEYQVEMRFSRGKPLLGYTEELRFVATNVHLIKDPNYASGDNYYVIDLTRPDTMAHLHYISVGTLVLNGIHGRGSFAFRVIDKTNDQAIKSAIVEDYAVKEDPTRPYNTKMVFSPAEGVVFYARDTGRDTYILETILIKQ